MILQVAKPRSKEKKAMAVPDSVDPAAWPAEQIRQGDPDLLRSMTREGERRRPSAARRQKVEGMGEGGAALFSEVPSWAFTLALCVFSEDD
ncbi:hypothetical protein ABT061_40645 [Streptosporangium sp. NPDC002544]|uniref:hypothetical protein n=1 Tax=Streptosporangium sp. NPDC002544 TaxID=3154538 RepID=UPI0033189408